MPDENYLQLLKNYILIQYKNIDNLTGNTKQEILNTLYEIKEIEHLTYRKNEFVKAGLLKEASAEQQKINTLYANLQNCSHNFQNSITTNNTSNMEEKIRIVLDFMKSHVQRVGREQAIKDFQYGLNILNKNRKSSKLKIDGDYGLKTNAYITYLCKFYSPKVICKSIRKAAITNAIFDTKNDKRVNTEKRIEQIRNDLDVERRI